MKYKSSESIIWSVSLSICIIVLTCGYTWNTRRSADDLVKIKQASQSVLQQAINSCVANGGTPIVESANSSTYASLKSCEGLK